MCYIGNQSIHLQLFGEHNARNALAAISIAILADVEFHKAVQNLAEFAGVKGRLQMLPGPNHSLLINDSYNANPDSLEAGVKVLCSLPGEAWLALGDMGELGDETETLHRRAAQMARDYGVKKMFGVGSMSSIACREFGNDGYYYEQLDEMAGSILGQLHQGINLLVKGSRAAGMDRLVDKLVSDTNRGDVNHVV